MKNLLLSGSPRCGKTTVIMEVVKHLSKSNCGGFYTGEIKESGRRTGFSINTLDGGKGTLSHVNIKGPPRVGRYGVNLADLERIAVPAVLEAVRNRRLVIIDEIGKMELFSEKFREAVLLSLDSPVPVLGTIMESNNPFADAVKRRQDVTLIQVTTENRGSLPDRLVSIITQER